MTDHRRPSSIVLAALMLAGCGATLRSPVPTPTSSPAVLATPTALPTLTPVPEVQACAGGPEGRAPAAILTNDAHVFWQPFVVTRVARVLDPDRPLPLPEPGPAAGAPQFMLGGSEIDLYLQYYEASWTEDPPTVDSLEITLDADGQAPVSLPVRLEPAERGYTAAFVDVPDITWSGPVTISATWHDPCFVFEATTTTWLFIDPKPSVSACATSSEPAFVELDAVFAASVRVGPRDAALVASRFTGKVTSLATEDILPAYTHFHSDRPTFSAEPGSTVRITTRDEGPVLTVRADTEVIFFRRGALVRWLEGGWIHGNEPEAEIVFRSPLVARPDGFTFTLPTDPGRYVAQPLFDYNSACSFGIAGMAVGIDVEE